jgi:hypothetical protein
MKTPYSDLPPERYWKTGVAEAHPSTIKNLYRKKFTISATDKIATAGSCFAQHVARHMRNRGYNILDVEPPIDGTPPDLAQKYGYMIYSGRYGNIYTARQMLQLLQDAETRTVRDEDIWTKNGRYYDGLRPSVEPAGLASIEEVKAYRLDHLERVSRLMRETDVLVFTLGLTETWMNRESGTIYPTCPGVIAGAFDDRLHEFVNFEFLEIYEDLKKIRKILKAKNPAMRFLLTVSPVPLTATASSDHILAATMYSKSVLRAVCGSLSKEYADVDYFPSYEVIASPFSKGFFFEPNMRSITEMGVETVMKVFFSEHSNVNRPGKDNDRKQRKAKKERDVVCEEVLLEAFSK